MQTNHATLPIEAVLLDLGNVLINVDFQNVFAYWSERCEVDVSRLAGAWTMDDAYQRHETGSLDFAGYVAALSERLGIDMAMDHWLAGWNAVFTDAVPGVADRLDVLRRHVPLYGFTNTNPTHHAYWAERFAGVLEPLTHVYVSSEIGLRKPTRGAFDHVARDIGVDSATIVFLDDTLENVEGARAAGLQAIWVRDAAEVVAALDALIQRIEEAPAAEERRTRAD